MTVYVNLVASDRFYFFNFVHSRLPNWKIEFSISSLNSMLALQITDFFKLNQVKQSMEDRACDSRSDSLLAVQEVQPLADETVRFIFASTVQSWFNTY